ncbi:MAG: DEAD/DEAH box helicase [Pseudomonadota bacterium]
MTGVEQGSDVASGRDRHVLAGFHPAVQAWFRESFASPTSAQELAWPPILAGKSTLLAAPTGSGKTLAAFLTALEKLMFEPPPSPARRCRILYVSPLKALAIDVERNLRAPLAGILQAAGERGEKCFSPVIAVRSGDTPAAERRLMARRPPDVLITTPESLFLILSSRARALLSGVQVVILDEIHALAGSKRGAHLALSIERVAEIAGGEPQRIGLSATARPLDEVARFLGGGCRAIDGQWRPRPVAVVAAPERKRLELRVEVPVAEMARPGSDEIGAIPSASRRQSVWQAIHPRLLELVRSHRSTIIFVNSRRLAERLAAALNDLAGEEIVRAHHGSIAREQRLILEELLKAGRLPALVATSTLELGIDMGAVDLVIQIEAPPSVASGVQRIGRGSHQAGAVSHGVLIPKYRGDLLSMAAITRAMQAGEVEPIEVPRCPLDVLSQQLVSMVLDGPRRVDDLDELVCRAAPYAGLSRAQLEGVLDMLAGRYSSERFADLRPRLVWDRRHGTVRAREGTRALVVANAGTIPDQGLFGVFLVPAGTASIDGGHGHGHGHGHGRSRPTSQRVGELDEEMVLESHVGDVFVLGASSWRIVEITRDRVLVVPATGEPGRMPFWKADRPPRPLALGLAIGRLTREILAATPLEAKNKLVAEHSLDESTAESLIAYLADQRRASGVVPDDRTIVLERFRDELGDYRLCLLSPFGGRLHATWALAIESTLKRAGEPEVDIIWTDDGIVIRIPNRERLPDASDLLPRPDETRDQIVAALGKSSLFAARFREAASRALLLPRRRPGARTPLWMQRRRAADLLRVAADFPSFPIVLETFRECLQEVLDLPALEELARGAQRRDLRLVTVDTGSPSPFAASLLFNYAASYLYEGDTPLAERRAQALSVDLRQLHELLGEAELRELLAAEVLDEVERALQGLEPGRRATSADQLHDLLLRLGDLTATEVSARIADPHGDAPGRDESQSRRDSGRPDGEPSSESSRLANELLENERAIEIRLAGSERLIAAEDAGRFRDAFGLPLPPKTAAGLPASFLEPVTAALDGIVARYARTHGPFKLEEFASRYALDTTVTASVLARLVGQGLLVEGELRPGSIGRDYCDVEVLARLRRRSLARLRHQVEPVAADAFVRFLLAWQGIDGGGDGGGGSGSGSGSATLLDVVERIQGFPIPVSVLDEVIRARLPEYLPADLDRLTTIGDVIWLGVAPLGDHDGRIALYLASELPLLRPVSAGGRPSEEIHQAIRELLATRGASFFSDLHDKIGGLQQTLVDALWSLVWAGEVTNDTCAPLRALGSKRSPAQRGRRIRSFGSHRSCLTSPPAAAGRWSLLGSRAEVEPSETERLVATSAQLLARYGILTGSSVAAENVQGGFSRLYPVLSALEEQGRARRGYFVAGLGGSQFADPGAIEKLRSLREPALLLAHDWRSRSEDCPASASTNDRHGFVLAASDPANPFGTVLAWPHHEARLARASGSHVVLVDGALAGFLTNDGAELKLFLPDAEPARSAVGLVAARAIARFADHRGQHNIGWASESPNANRQFDPFFVAAGFQPWGRGFSRSRRE